jgi:hypothetical protein
MATGTTTRETASLIGSDKVEGTAVYGSDERRIPAFQINLLLVPLTLPRVPRASMLAT